MIMETNKKSYLKPTIEELYMYEDLSIMESSNSEPMIDDGQMAAKHNNGDFAFDDFSDDDEDGFSYKKYTVKW